MAEDLKQFINKCESYPSILNDSSLGFFRNNSQSFDARIHAESQSRADTVGEDEVVESDIELDETDVVEPDNDPPQKMGDSSIEVSEENRDAAQVLKVKAELFMHEGHWNEAISYLTEAIMLNPHSEILYTVRGGAFIEQKKPNAAVRDAFAALEINPNFQNAYQVRGMARAMLGNWEEAADDLHTALMINFDQENGSVMRKVVSNVHKIEAHRRKYECLREQRVLKAIELQKERQKFTKVTQEKSLLKDVEAVGLLTEVMKDMHKTLRALGGSELTSSKRKQDAELCSGGKGLLQGASGSSTQPSMLHLSSKVKGKGSSLLCLPSPSNVVQLQAAYKRQRTNRLVEGGSQDRSYLTGQVLKLVGATKEDQPIPSSAEVALTKAYLDSLETLRAPTSNSDLNKEVTALKSQVEALSSDKTQLLQQLATLEQSNTRLKEEKSRLVKEDKHLRFQLKNARLQSEKKCQTIKNSIAGTRNLLVRALVDEVLNEFATREPDHIDFEEWEEWAARVWDDYEEASYSASEVGSPSS